MDARFIAPGTTARELLAAPGAPGYQPVMIQVSFELGPDITPPRVAAPLRLEPTGFGHRLTGHWPHNDLQAARRQVSGALADLAATSALTCLFTGRTQPLADWRLEWAAPPTVASTFEARHAIVEGRLFARLFGSYQLGESDVVLVADGGSDVAEVYELLSSWARFRLEPRREAPRWDRPFPYGYGLLSFAESEVGDAEFWNLMRESLQSHHLRRAFDDRMESPSPRVLIESEDPADPDAPYAIGAAHTLAARARQRQTLARLASFYEGAPFADTLESGSASPNAQDAALACDRYTERPGDAFAYREAPKGPLDSGWRFGCLDPDHTHTPSTLRILPLGQAVRSAPAFLDYLALPAGWSVTLESGERFTTPPGEDRSYPDEPTP